MNSSDRRGFTLLEVTLVIGILTIMLGATMAVSYNALVSTSLRAAENILVQTIRRAQTMSQNNVDGKQWGIYICDTASLVSDQECDTTSATAVVLYGRIGNNVFGALDIDTDQLFEVNAQIVFSGDLFVEMKNADKGLTFKRASGDPVDTDLNGDIIMTRTPEFRTVNVNIRGVVEH